MKAAVLVRRASVVNPTTWHTKRKATGTRAAGGWRSRQPYFNEHRLLLPHSTGFRGPARGYLDPNSLDLGLVASVNTSREGAHARMLARGFRLTPIIGVGMHLTKRLTIEPTCSLSTIGDESEDLGIPVIITE